MARSVTAVTPTDNTGLPPNLKSGSWQGGIRILDVNACMGLPVLLSKHLQSHDMQASLCMQSAQTNHCLALSMVHILLNMSQIPFHLISCRSDVIFVQCWNVHNLDVSQHHAIQGVHCACCIFPVELAMSTLSPRGAPVGHWVDGSSCRRISLAKELFTLAPPVMNQCGQRQQGKIWSPWL